MGLFCSKMDTIDLDAIALAQATVIMDIQKKMVTLLGLASAATTDAAL